jgi:hypothetical protein
MLERDGRPLSVGRRTRSVSPALRRALESRDRGCRFPGCERRRFLHAHHIRHWARGGRTDLSNLLQLCGFHHRLIHEGGYTIEPRTRGELLFRRPDGRAVEPAPQRQPGDRHQLQQHNRRAGLTLNDNTCVPQTDFQRTDIAWIVDAETDPRLGD